MTPSGTETPVIHETITLEHTYAFPIHDVYAAWADPAARTVWGTPSDNEALEFESTDYRVGGRDVSRCGPKGDLSFRVETTYLDIVPEVRVLYSEVASNGGNRLSVALQSALFEATDSSTRLRLVIQIASFVGKGMIEGNRDGSRITLDNLDRFLQHRKG